MRRYSTSTVFGLPRLSEATGGRRHSSTQLTDLSPASHSPTRSDRWKTLAKVVLGDVEEQQEESGTAQEGERGEVG